MSDWHLYIIRTGMNTLYTGITTDVQRRLRQHLGEEPNGAKYLRAKGPLELVYQVPIGDRSQASSVEHAVKKLSRPDKDEIVKHQPRSSDLLIRLGMVQDSQ